MTDRLTEGLNPEEIKKLDRQAEALARDFMETPDQKATSNDSVIREANNPVLRIVEDPITGRKTVYRTRGINEALPAANIRSRGGQILPYNTKPPSNIIRFKR